MLRYGVIDLGTNTFHLLIAEPAAGGGFDEVYREQQFIKLGEGGLDILAEGPVERGIQTIRGFRGQLDRQGVRLIRVIGTAALRSASNGADFIRRVEAETGLKVELISGEREAGLIFRGVSAAVPFGEEPFLVMDIGGGSVELILANRHRIFGAQSFPAGLAVIKRHFPQEGPFLPGDVDAIQRWLGVRFSPFYPLLEAYPPAALVGAAGTFDVLEDLIHPERVSKVCSFFHTADFHSLYGRMLSTTLGQRLHMDGLPPSRADMFVLALILIDHLLQRARVNRVIVSRYAMKEGVLAEMFRE